MHYFEMSALRRLLAMLDGAKHFRAPVLRSSGARLALRPVSAGLTSPPPSEFILLPPLTAPHGRDSICEVAQTWAAFRPCRIAVPQIRDWVTWGAKPDPAAISRRSGFARRFALHNVEMSLLRHLQTLASMRQKMQNHASRTSLSQYGAIKTGGYDLPLVARNPF